MGRKDVIRKLFWEDNARFADLVNTVFGHGRQLISGEQLKTGDTALQMKNHGKEKGREGYRDIIRKVVNGASVYLIGIENQELTHYAMPARVMLMDAAGYDRQLRGIARGHRKANDLKEGAQYLSGIGKGELLKPICTITLYYGEEPWDGPRSLHELLDFTGVPEGLKGLFRDYPLTLVEVRRFPQWEKFKTDLREVFGFMQSAEDKEELKKFLEKNQERMSRLPEEAVEFIGDVAGIEGIPAATGEERKMNMCKAIADMLQDSREEGREEGEKKGREEGEKKGIRLTQWLLRQNRMDDLERALTDEEYRKRLYDELDAVKI